MLVRLSHLPDDWGSLDPKSGLGGSLGAGMRGEYLEWSGGGARKQGLVTITGVCGFEGGEQSGVIKSSLLGERDLLTAGDKGGWLGGWAVGLIPGIIGVSDINFWVVGILTPLCWVGWEVLAPVSPKRPQQRAFTSPHTSRGARGG